MIVISMTFTKCEQQLAAHPCDALPLARGYDSAEPLMPMPSLTPRWRESWRVLAYSVALALAFIGLQRLELALFSAFGTPEVLRLDRRGAGARR